MESKSDKKAVNPWVVKSLFEFNYFCCPECDSHCQQKQEFVNHAFKNHPESIEAFHEIKDGSLSDIKFPNQTCLLIKDEDITDIIPGKCAQEPVKAEIIQVPGLRIEKLVVDSNQSISVDIISKVLTEQSPKVIPISGEQLTELRPFHCLFCKEYFDSKARLNNHGCASVVPSTAFDSNPKPKVLESSKNSSKQIVKRERQGGFSCELCDFKVKSMTFYKQHVRRVHKGENALKCSTCCENFQTSHHLKSHLWKEHEIGKGNEACLCSLCGKTIIGRNNFKKHERERHGIDNAKFTRKKHDTKIKCLKCSTEFKSVLELNDHEVLAHCTGSEAKNFSCNQCDLVWTSGHVLTLHIKVDHGMTEVNPCDICGKILKSKHSLDSHKKVDHQGGIKDHICHLCGRGFFRPVALKDHIIRIHEGSGKYFCDRCPFKAMCKKELEIHINACHTKAVKFQCLQCSYSGFRESALGTHIRTVHQNYKPNKCDLCDMAFVAKRDLKKHKENKH